MDSARRLREPIQRLLGRTCICYNTRFALCAALCTGGTNTACHHCIEVMFCRLAWWGAAAFHTSLSEKGSIFCRSEGFLLTRILLESRVCVRCSDGDSDSPAAFFLLLFRFFRRCFLPAPTRGRGVLSFAVRIVAGEIRASLCGL